MKTWVKVALVLGGVALLVTVLFVLEDRRQSSMTAEATATVSQVEFRPDAESSSLDDTAIAYRFEVNGAGVESSTTISGDKTADYRPGQQVRICYNPEDPRVSDIRAEGRPCG